MPKPRSVYKSYLLRLWCSEADGAAWRASLEDARSGARQGFATLDQLFSFLRDQAAGGTPRPDEVETTGVMPAPTSDE